MGHNDIAQLLREAADVLTLDEKTVQSISITDIDSHIDGLADRLRNAAASLEAQGPVAVVRIHKTGGNVGIAWSGTPLPDAPLMREGDKLYCHPPTSAVPEGWKLVPVEPTQEMIDRGAEEVDWYAHNARYCYMAMLDAAPQQGGRP